VFPSGSTFLTAGAGKGEDSVGDDDEVVVVVVKDMADSEAGVPVKESAEIREAAGDIITSGRWLPGELKEEKEGSKKKGESPG